MEEFSKLLQNQNKLFEEFMRRVQNDQPQAAVAPVSPSVPLPPPLAIEGDMEENFSFFEANWKNYATAVGMDNWPVQENAKKVSFLLSIVGAPALKKYFNFELTEDDKRTSDSVLAAIKRKVVSARNVIVDRLDFFTASQLSSECIDDYVSRLKVMAKVCHFGVLESEMLTYKIVTSNKWPHLKSKMLTMVDITAAKAVDLCRIEEITTKHTQVLSLDGKKDVQKVKCEKTRKCKFCGEWHVFAKGSCPAYGKKCQKCGGKNHYKKVCRAGMDQRSRKKKSRKVKCVTAAVTARVMKIRSAVMMKIRMIRRSKGKSAKFMTTL